MTAAVASARLWLGPSPATARDAYHRARAGGMTALRALVVGNIASHRDCWAFRKRLASQVGCSVRTVQRAITQAASMGLIGVARAKRGERPPGLDSEVPCGWSHRWIVGFGQAGAAVKRAVDAARARWIARRSVTPTSPGACVSKACRPKMAAPTFRRDKPSWTAEELDRELERLAREKPPP
jgi:hypothetical protein